MSGAEIIGLISGIITVVETSITLYKALEGGSSLPPSFRDSAARLPLVQESLALVKENIDADSSSTASQDALVKVLEACAERATTLRNVFQTMTPPAGVSSLMRGFIIMKAMSKAKDVEKLVGGIREDLQLLTANHAVKAATRTQIEALMAGIRKREEASAQKSSEAVRVRETVLRKQYVYNGVGNQNIASDKATQINGTCVGSTFNFSHA